VVGISTIAEKIINDSISITISSAIESLPLDKHPHFIRAMTEECKELRITQYSDLLCKLLVKHNEEVKLLLASKKIIGKHYFNVLKEYSIIKERGFMLINNNCIFCESNKYNASSDFKSFQCGHTYHSKCLEEIGTAKVCPKCLEENEK
jgi:hypothetical protein